jgi:hypothetical protein
MKNPIRKNEGQINISIPKDNRIEAIMDIASSNEQIAIALKNAAESNIQLAKALQVSPQITITGCTVIGNGQFDTGISIKGESDYDEYHDTYENDDVEEDESYEESVGTFNIDTFNEEDSEIEDEPESEEL